jgi:hypothetical protein
MGAWIHVERGLGGIMVVTPIAIEVWMSSCWNDRGHVVLGRGSRAPVDSARSHPFIGGSKCRDWGPPWLPVLPEGSTGPSGEAEVS